MKKTQFALAALALVASSAVLANGVTLYGTLDAGIASSTGSTKMYGGGNNGTTSFGITGSEDLGGGLKAGFKLESGINLATGAMGDNGGGNTNLFNRAANISLSNENFGLTVGNQFSNVVLQSGFVVGGSAVGGDGVNVPGVVRLFGGTPGGVVTDNGATTNGSPTPGLFGDATSGIFFIPQAVQVSFNQSGVAGDVMVRVNKRDSFEGGYTAATLRGSLGAVNVGVGYQDITAIGGLSQKSTLVFANTQIANIRVNGAYSHNSGDAGDSNGYMMGASMPVAAALTAGVAYSNNKDAGLGSMTSVSLDYALSKRTMAYATYAHFNLDGGGSAVGNASDISITGKNLTTVGLKHSF